MFLLIAQVTPHPGPLPVRGEGARGCLPGKERQLPRPSAFVIQRRQTWDTPVFSLSPQRGERWDSSAG